MDPAAPALRWTSLSPPQRAGGADHTQKCCDLRLQTQEESSGESQGPGAASHPPAARGGAGAAVLPSPASCVSLSLSIPSLPSRVSPSLSPTTSVSQSPFSLDPSHGARLWLQCPPFFPEAGWAGAGHSSPGMGQGPGARSSEGRSCWGTFIPNHAPQTAPLAPPPLPDPSHPRTPTSLLPAADTCHCLF